MRSQWFVGLLILGKAALITAITSVTVAAISLTQQVYTAQYVDSMSKNVSFKGRCIFFTAQSIQLFNPSLSELNHYLTNIWLLSARQKANTANALLSYIQVLIMKFLTSQREEF